MEHKTVLTKNPLKYLKEYFRMTQAEVAMAIGKKQTSYSDLETGKTRLTTDVINQLAKFYKVDKQIFTTDLPESEWHKFLNPKEYLQGFTESAIDQLSKPESNYSTMENEKNNTENLVLSLEIERLKEQVESYKKMNTKLISELNQKASLIDALKEEQKKSTAT
jgi:transcriptional regulator with XRE-family HTH domain